VANNSKYEFIESTAHVLTIFGSRSLYIDAPSFRFRPDSFVGVNFEIEAINWVNRPTCSYAVASNNKYEWLIESGRCAYSLF